MAASSNTFCATSQRKLMQKRFLAPAPLALALAACAPAGGDDRDTPAIPPGFELAAAKQPASSSQSASEVREIDVAELQALLAQGNVRLIDVRRDDEVAAGKIPGAEHIQLDRFDPAKLDLSDGREVVIYCRSGRRSAIAAERLSAHTGEPATHLAGGILAWQEAGGDTD